MKPLTFGPIPSQDGHIHWNLWAPRARRATLHLLDASSLESSASTCVDMIPLKHGFFFTKTISVPIGQRYGFSIDGGPIRPDPASRWQPEGVHQASAYWTASEQSEQNTDWRGIPVNELVIYELHVGTFTKRGTLDAALEELDDLARLGVNTIELMPVAQFPGEFGWGYDGVYWYAVHNAYGGPHALERFVQQCHQRKISVLLDVVYNHFGPEGNYMGEFAPIYSQLHHTPWGHAINFDGPHSLAMRDFVVENALYWIRDFQVDGFRIDAVHALIDDSPVHILRAIKDACVKESVQSRRPIYVIAESNLNDVVMLNPPILDGYGLDVQWNDDFHHCIHAMLTHERDGYYVDFDLPAQQLEKAMNDVFVYDGIHSKFLGKEHGKPAGQLDGERFVVSIQTHDQVGNRAKGDRFGTLLDVKKQRLAAGLLLLSPYTPMLFMGEEYGETNCFPFFCDFGDERIKEAVRKGRREEFQRFHWEGEIADPTSRTTFEAAKLSLRESIGEEQWELKRLYEWLIRFRQSKGNLTNRSLVRCKLHSLGEGIPILELTRFLDSHHVHLDWSVVFNLGEHPCRLGSELFSSSVSEFFTYRSDEIERRRNSIDELCNEPLAPALFKILEPRSKQNILIDCLKETR